MSPFSRVIGLNSLELAVWHVLPNILPALIIITLLELGAVLMILGELGFVGVYIGGGLTVQTGDTTSERYFSVQEWGVILWPTPGNGPNPVPGCPSFQPSPFSSR